MGYTSERLAKSSMQTAYIVIALSNCFELLVPSGAANQVPGIKLNCIGVGCASSLSMTKTSFEFLDVNWM